MPPPKQHPWTLPRAHKRYLLDVRLVVKVLSGKTADGKPLSVKTADVKMNETLLGRTKDIAEGGLGATIPGNINIGDVVELEFQLPDASEPLKLKAEVRYRQGFQYGFKYLHATEQQRESIRRATHALPMAP